MRMADIEAIIQIQVCGGQKLIELFGGRHTVRNVFQQDFHAALTGENADLIERGKSGINPPLIEILIHHAQMLNQIRKGTLSAISMARLISSTMAMRFAF